MLRSFIFLLALFLAGSPGSWAAAAPAYLVRRAVKPAERIPGLGVEPLAEIREKAGQRYIVLKGTLATPRAPGTGKPPDLKINSAPVPVQNTGRFLFGLPHPETQKKDTTLPVVISVVTSAGQARETLTIHLTPPPAPSLPPAKTDFFSVGLQGSSISYTETGQANYTSISLTVKINYIHRFKDSPWELGGSTYITALPLTKSRTEDARFWGVNLRGGVRLPILPNPWSLRLLIGGYYTRMFVTNLAFGFADMWGPQVFPVISRAFSEGTALSIYGKYSPVTAGGALTFSSRELAFGSAFSWGLSGGRRLDLIVDVALMTVVVDATSASATSISAGVAYGF